MANFLFVLSSDDSICQLHPSSYITRDTTHRDLILTSYTIRVFTTEIGRQNRHDRTAYGPLNTGVFGRFLVADRERGLRRQFCDFSAVEVKAVTGLNCCSVPPFPWPRRTGLPDGLETPVGTFHNVGRTTTGNGTNQAVASLQAPWGGFLAGPSCCHLCVRLGWFCVRSHQVRQCRLSLCCVLPRCCLGKLLCCLCCCFISLVGDSLF